MKMKNKIKKYADFDILGKPIFATRDIKKVTKISWFRKIKNKILLIIATAFLIAFIFTPVEPASLGFPALQEKVLILEGSYNPDHNDIVKRIVDIGLEQGLSEGEIQLVIDIIREESQFNPQANLLTDQENSWGLVQINLYAHPQITQEQATDIDFAIRFLIKGLRDGNGCWWTGYRNLTGECL